MFVMKKLVSLNCLRFPRVFFSTNGLPKEEKIKIGKYEINYLKVGHGPHKVLCTPGALGTVWVDYKPLIEQFKQDKFSLVVWDPPGYGKSLPPHKEYTIDFFQRDADTAYALMKELEIPKFSLLGFSDGGIMSLILAAKYSNAVNKMVVWGANSFILPTELESYKHIKDVNNWSKRMSEPLIEIYGKERLIKTWADWVDAMELIYNTNEGNICSDVLQDIKCPTYILYGEKDPLVDCVHVSHLHTQINGSRIYLYPDGKHNIHLRYAEDFNKRVQEFLLRE